MEVSKVCLNFEALHNWVADNVSFRNWKINLKKKSIKDIYEILQFITR